MPKVKPYPAWIIEACRLLEIYSVIFPNFKISVKASRHRHTIFLDGHPYRTLKRLEAQKLIANPLKACPDFELKTWFPIWHTMNCPIWCDWLNPRGLEKLWLEAAAFHWGHPPRAMYWRWWGYLWIPVIVQIN